MANYRITNIKLGLKEGWDSLPQKIEKACGLRPGSISKKSYQVIKESLDARDKSNIHRVYTLDFFYNGSLPAKGRKRTTKPSEKKLPSLTPGEKPLTGRPVVVGFGPCGIYAALRLSQLGYAPLVVERGRSMEERIGDVDAFWQNGILNPESNVLFGEGGAGTFSDGKLTSGIKDPHVHWVLKAFVDAGAPPDILYTQKPHIGTDILREVVVNLRRAVEAAGGEVRFNTRLTAIHAADGALTGVTLEANGKQEDLQTNALILAPGHSARDTFRALNGQGLTMAQKPFSIGLRMEHPQERIDRGQYGDVQGLPPASYKLSYRASNGRGVYSFCMCPGGEVIPCSNAPGYLCVNGMSRHSRDSGTANAGILVDVRTQDFSSQDPLAGIEFQEQYEAQAFKAGGQTYTPPSCTYGEFKEGTGAAPGVLSCLPDFAQAALLEAMPVFGKRIAGFDQDDAVLTAVETRSSSPVRILRDATYQSEISGLYPAGEGAGYAGGITSAACDGLRVAEALVRHFAQPNSNN